MQVSIQLRLRYNLFLHDFTVFPPNPPVRIGALNSFLFCFSFRNDVTSSSDVTFACLPVSWTAKGNFKTSEDLLDTSAVNDWNIIDSAELLNKMQMKIKLIKTANITAISGYLILKE